MAKIYRSVLHSRRLQVLAYLQTHPHIRSWKMLKATIATVFKTHQGLDHRSKNPVIVSIRQLLEKRPHYNNSLVLRLWPGESSKSLRQRGFVARNGRGVTLQKATAAAVNRLRAAGSGVGGGCFEPSRSHFNFVAVDQFLFQSLMHAKYDVLLLDTACTVVQVERRLRSCGTALAKRMAIHEGERDAVCDFLCHRRHCRSHDAVSQCTHAVRCHAKNLDDARRARFALYVVMGLNSECVVGDWATLSVVTKPTEIQAGARRVLECAAQRHGLRPACVAVSRATATTGPGGLGAGDLHQRIAVHISLAIQRLSAVVDLQQVTTQSLKSMVPTLSDLQAIMWCRHFHGDGPLVEDEVAWTAYSARGVKDLVQGRRSTAVHQTISMRLLRQLMMERLRFFCLKRLVRDLERHLSVALFTGRHLEHQGCERGKTLSGKAPWRTLNDASLRLCRQQWSLRVG
mmetsp:Transcript_43388/g.86017  ORF Transcript_43388/g.86017 Transcript_43388/m.86017 type:complete len:457 (+) Transcript_43388:110-1480(+)